MTKKKKILLGIGLLAAAVVTIPLFAAFEAHVINVTAKIENALSVDTTPIEFGTVFPQEELDQNIEIALSQSFIDENRVDDVDYIIRQKPKCGWTMHEGQELIGETQSGHVDANGNITCPSPIPLPALDAGALNSVEPVWGSLPLLCPYLSKHKDVSDPDANQGETEVPAFHKPWTFDVEKGLLWTDAKGHLTKKGEDVKDVWTIDLKVPCFGDHCAQDWASFVTNINPAANPDDYIQPIENEHKIFGCDLWIEVGGISLPNEEECFGKADLMLVLDRSGSIDSGELATLKTAAKAFVTALVPSADGAHTGMSSFSTTGSLDVHLTDNAATMNAAIDALSSGGTTHLQDGIEIATGELTNPGDGHDRADNESSDYIVIITDGAPNQCNGSGCNPQTAAANAADAARAAGIEIYVVGVGTDSGTANYLRTEIADDAAHYFDAADFNDLEAILVKLTECENGNPTPTPSPTPSISPSPSSSPSPSPSPTPTPTPSPSPSPSPSPTPTPLFTDSFGTGSTDSTFDEDPAWTEGGSGAVKRAAGSDDNTASPDGGRFTRVDGSGGYLCRTIDTTGFLNILLSYYWRGDVDANNPSDDGIVEIKAASGNSCSDGSGWTELQNHDLQSDASWTTQAGFGNAGMENTSFLLRFRAASSNTNSGFRIDGVLIMGLAI